MGSANRQLLSLALGAFCAAWVGLAFTPVAEAQFFRWFEQQQQPRKAPKPRRVRPPGDDLPPILPRESSAPPPPDDRPYDDKLMRLAEILGAIHYLRELCGAQEGQIWRDQMKEILRNEGTTAVRRAKLVNSFNDGYRGFRRTYRTCTQSATLATTRFSAEGATIAASLAQGSEFANKGPEAKPESESAISGGETLPAPDGASEGQTPAAATSDQTGGLVAEPPSAQSGSAAPQPAPGPAPVEEPPD